MITVVMKRICYKNIIDKLVTMKRWKQQVLEFLKEQEDVKDHNQHQWQQFDDGQLSILQNNDDIDHDVDDNDNLDHDIINDNNELTRNDDDFLLEMENWKFSMH